MSEQGSSGEGSGDSSGSDSESAGQDTSGGAGSSAPESAATTDSGGGESDSSAVAAEVNASPEEADGRPTSVPELIGFLSLRDEISLNWATLEELATVNQSQARKLVDMAYDYREFLPALGGAIAQEEDPSTEVSWPTADQIKDTEGILPGPLVGIMNILPSGLSRRVDALIEHQAQSRIRGIAQVVAQPLQAIGRFDTPRTEFLDELTRLHEALVQPANRAEHGKQTAVRLRSFMGQFNLWHFSAGTKGREPEDPSLHHEQYPLLYNTLGSLPGGRLGLGTLMRGHLGVRAATPEIIRGLESFLRDQGVNIPTSEASAPPSLLRTALNKYAPRLLAGIPGRVESALLQVYDLLPENGKDFKEEVLAFCRKLNERGKRTVVSAADRGYANTYGTSGLLSANRDMPCPPNDPDCWKNKTRK